MAKMYKNLHVRQKSGPSVQLRPERRAGAARLVPRCCAVRSPNRSHDFSSVEFLKRSGRTLFTYLLHKFY